MEVERLERCAAADGYQAVIESVQSQNQYSCRISTAPGRSLKPSGNTFGDHTFRQRLHLQTSKPKLGEAREALNDHVHRCVDVQFLAESHVELGEWQLPHTCNTQCQIKAFDHQCYYYEDGRCS